MLYFSCKVWWNCITKVLLLNRYAKGGNQLECVTELDKKLFFLAFIQVIV